MQASFISRHEGPGEEAGRGTALDVRSRMFVTLLSSAVTIAVSSFEGQMVLFAASFLYALSIRRFRALLPLALTSRIQALLTALKSLRLPFCIYIPGAVMIRFIPTFMNDIRQVAETLKIRGYRLGFGEMFRHPLMMLRLMFTPLLFRSLRTSEELGIAAELKGLEAGGRFVPFRGGAWTRRDTALVLLSVACALLALYCHAVWGGESMGMR